MRGKKQGQGRAGKQKQKKKAHDGTRSQKPAGGETDRAARGIHHSEITSDLKGKHAVVQHWCQCYPDLLS